MRKLATREKVLLVLLGVVAVVVLLRLGGDVLGIGGPPTDEAELFGPLGEPPRVDMDLLSAKAENYDPDGRNLFDYYVPPRPVVKRETPPPMPPRIEQPPVVRQQVTAPPIDRTPKPPQPSFAYIGLIGPKDGKIGVFDDGQGVKLARIGEIVQDPFRLREFTFDGVVLAYADGQFKGQTTELKKRTK